MRIDPQKSYTTSLWTCLVRRPPAGHHARYRYGDERAGGGATGGANAPRGSSASPRASLWAHSSPRTRALVRCHSTRAQRRLCYQHDHRRVGHRADAQRQVHVPPLVGIRSRRWTGPFQARVVSVPATRGCPSVRGAQRERLGGYNPISSRPNLYEIVVNQGQQFCGRAWPWPRFCAKTPAKEFKAIWTAS